MSEEDFVFVEYLSNINKVVKQTFQSMQRIKLVCFDSSPNFLVFGATSGGIYIFRRDPCQFLKLIPSKEGSVNLIAISRDERHIGIASSKGFTLIFENFIEDNSTQYQVFSEHEGKQITYIKWHRNELYIGDDGGKVSVVSVMTALFQTKSIFQIPSASLMTLDSCVVQIDAYRCYLLISTKTKTYLCNTEKEFFIQIGKKLRDGYFGACFCNTSNDVGEIVISQNARSAFQSVKEDEIIVSGDNTTNTKIFCARPGARLWEVGFDAKVLVTYQFKSTLNEHRTELFIIGYEEESVLERRLHNQEEKVPDNFSFQKIYPICDRFILTYDSDRLYIFDPESSKLIFWTAFSTSIKYVAFANNNVYVWKDNLEINILSVVELEHLILATLYKKQFYLCSELCIEFCPIVLKLLEESRQLYLISALKSKISSEELLTKLQPVLDKVKETNEKVFTRQNKGNIVLVENLYLDKEVSIPPQKKPEEDENKDLKVILKQYKLNKTHRTIEIPEVMQLFETLNAEDIFGTFKRFMEYVKMELGEDSTEWCQDQYLKQISKRSITVQDLKNDSFEFLTEAVIKVNESINFSCSCGYPLPKCHKNPPNFYKTALDIFKTPRNPDKILKYVPYLWRYRVKTEVFGLNMTALIQYSHLGLFKEHTMQLTYDNWHDILGYFVKICKGLCLNCDRQIDIEGVLTWTELAKVIVQSLGAKNTVRILEKYEKFIPNGALDPTFYQTCIFAHSFINDNSNSIVKADELFKFIENVDKDSYGQFQDAITKYFKRKYLASKNPYCTFSIDNTGACLTCNLPLKNDILFDCETVKSCGHKFHKFCFERNSGTCNVCN